MRVDHARPSTLVIAVLAGVDTLVAAAQEWVLRSGGDCAAAACSAATLGGHPRLCLALAVGAVITLAGGWIVRETADLPGWDVVRWTGVVLSVVASAGAVLVAAAAMALAALALAILVAGARVLGTR